MHFVFVHCTEWGSLAWFPGGGIFFGRGCTVYADLTRHGSLIENSLRRVCQDGTFPEDFHARKLDEIFVF